MVFKADFMLTVVSIALLVSGWDRPNETDFRPSSCEKKLWRVPKAIKDKSKVGQERSDHHAMRL